MRKLNRLIFSGIINIKKVDDKLVILKYILTDQQIMDGLTKSLLKNKFLAF